MATAMENRPAASDRQWFIVSRWQEYEGEGRANLLRIIGVTAFYAVELYYYHVHLEAEARATHRPFHLAMTLLALTWTMVGLGVLLCRKNFFFPATLKYISNGCDIVLLTAVLAMANGPASPLVVVYLLILALAALRFSLPLIWFATGGCLTGYVFLLGYARWAPVDPPPPTVPRYHQLIFVPALVLIGVILGQIIRRVRSLALSYAERQTRIR